MFRCLIVRLPAIVLAMLMLGGSASANESLRVELAAAAKNLKQFLAGQGQDSIAVGTFSGPPEASSGPLLSKLMAEELTRAGITVKLRAALIVEGNYIDVTDKSTKLLAAKLLFRVVNRQREELVKFERAVFGDDTLPVLFGMSVSLPPRADRQTRDKHLQHALDHPRPEVAGSRVGTPGSPYAIEVLIKQGDDYQPRRATVNEGLPFVAIKRGEVYAVRLINDADHEAAVTLTIDGLNFFTFTDERNKKGKPFTIVFVGPRKSETIKGWYRAKNQSDEFLVTEYAKSGAALLKSTANLGTITACFAASWGKDATPPADEPKNPAPHSRSADATGFGSRIATPFDEVERNIGVIRATVSVRYTK
jgi:hypothetical protein